jgi:tRNA U34 5-carboxymethylaminomethyl modifying GTPase MnmE/TrmE
MMSKAYETETICALSTPNGVGGIAVVRVSGPAAIFMQGWFEKRYLESCMMAIRFWMRWW